MNCPAQGTAPRIAERHAKTHTFLNDGTLIDTKIRSMERYPVFISFTFYGNRMKSFKI